MLAQGNAISSPIELKNRIGKMQLSSFLVPCLPIQVSFSHLRELAFHVTARDTASTQPTWPAHSLSDVELGSITTCGFDW